MKVIIVGAGASGVAAAINIKRKNPSDDVLIIEHLDKPLKKILATGNGKCNLGNSNIDFSLFNNGEFAKKIIDGYDYEKFFDSLLVKTKLVGELAYPVSESAVTVRDAMLNELRKLHVKMNVSEKLVDYKVEDQISVITDKKTYVCDKLILAGGLKSSPKLGSDGSVIEILRKHNYKINELNPGLCPIRTVENTKVIDGTRCKANVKLVQNNKIVRNESGEVLFKDHGLSGIVILNTMSQIVRNNVSGKIYIDLLPDYSDEYLTNFMKTHSLDEFLLAFINPKISSYLKEMKINENNIVSIVKNLEFTFDKPYGYDFSQVTVGGVDINEVDTSLMSKKEKNVFIIGELLNVDGPCGGYNLTFAFACANKLK